MTDRQTCDASTIVTVTDVALAGVPHTMGPCILRHGHDGPLHKEAGGATWASLQVPGCGRECRAGHTYRGRCELAMPSMGAEPSEPDEDGVASTTGGELDRQLAENHARYGYTVGVWFPPQAPWAAVARFMDEVTLQAYNLDRGEWDPFVIGRMGDQLGLEAPDEPHDHASCDRCDVTDPCPCCGLRWVDGRYVNVDGTPYSAEAPAVPVRERYAAVLREALRDGPWNAIVRATTAVAAVRDGEMEQLRDQLAETEAEVARRHADCQGAEALLAEVRRFGELCATSCHVVRAETGRDLLAVLDRKPGR